MKRDMDLCRRILFEIEGNDVGTPIEMLQVEAGLDVVIGHLLILKDAELIEGRIDRHARDYSIRRLTWSGHDSSTLRAMTGCGSKRRNASRRQV